MCVCYPLFGMITGICNIMPIIIVIIIMHIYYLTVYMFFISSYGRNKEILCDYCTFVQMPSTQFNPMSQVVSCTGGLIRLVAYHRSGPISQVVYHRGDVRKQSPL